MKNKHIIEILKALDPEADVFWHDAVDENNPQAKFEYCDIHSIGTGPSYVDGEAVVFISPLTKEEFDERFVFFDKIRGSGTSILLTSNGDL